VQQNIPRYVLLEKMPVMTTQIVGISGNFSRPSKARTLVQAITDETVRRGAWKAQVYDLVDAMPALATAVSRTSADPQLLEIWQAIENCDALVVGSPVYKASYTGLLKHLFDLIDMGALRDRPVALVATAKAPQHYLMIEHQFKPLFAFFDARIVSQSIFATDSSFTAEGNVGDNLGDKISRIVDQLINFVG
jgi:FMN reductase